MDSRVPELFELYSKGLSPRMISKWLKENKNESVSHERIRQLLKTHPNYKARSHSEAKALKGSSIHSQTKTEEALKYLKHYENDLMTLDQIAQIYSVSQGHVGVWQRFER